MIIIGFGGWVYYYYFLLGATLTKVLKEDIFGFGKTFQLLNDLIISKHKFLILFINYFSEFSIGIIIYLCLNYFEKRHLKRKEEYEKLKSGKIIEKDENEKKKAKKRKKRQEMELMAKDKDAILNPKNNNLIKEEDKLNAHLALLIDKKLQDINNNNLNNNNNNDNFGEHVVPKKCVLIHNDMYEEITENSTHSIILSSFLLIINDVVVNLFFSKKEIFDYFFFNILIMALIYKCHYKKQIYNHQTLALVIIIVIAGTLFFSSLFEKIQINRENIMIWEIFNEKQYMVFVFMIIDLVSSIVSSYGIIIQKRLMDYKFTSPYKIIFIRGLLGMIISGIVVTLTTCFPCKGNNTDDMNTAINKNISFLYENLNSNSTEDNNITSPPLIECLDEYNNKTYFDNIFSYFYNLINLNETKNKYLEIFLYIPLYFILTFITNILIILVNKNLTPFHCLIVDALYRLIDMPIQIIQNYNITDYQKFFYEYINNNSSITAILLRIIAYFISLLGYFIYLEIIELKFCGLNNNIVKNIRKRAILDGKTNSEIFSNRTDSTNSCNSVEDDDSIKIE